MLWGVHPIEFLEIWHDNMTAFMSQNLIKTVFGKATRSGFYNLVAPIRHVYHAPEAGFDVLGGVVAIGLSVGVAFLMRLLLTN